jgi:HK97 gp10 family phage protein
MNEILGLPELDRNLQNLAREVDSDDFETELLKIGGILRDNLKAASPVGPPGRHSKKAIKLAGLTVGNEITERSGNLKKSWRAKKFKSKRKGNPATFVANERKLAPHAQLVEFGHGGPHPAPPHPFVRPTVDKFKGEYSRLVQTMLREKFGKVHIDTAGSL